MHNLVSDEQLGFFAAKKLKNDSILTNVVLQLVRKTIMLLNKNRRRLAMKKLLILILIALLLILTFYIGMQGVSFGKVEVLGIKGIQAKSAQLDTTSRSRKISEKIICTSC